VPKSVAMPLLFSLLVAFASVAVGYPFARRVWPDASTSERAALAGGLSLALCAYVIFFFGLAGHLRVGISVTGAMLLLGGMVGAKSVWVDLRGARPNPWALVLLPFLAIAVLAAMSPPLVLDWDSLAYHLALPKLWLQADRVQSYPYDHHSYFPQLMEMLFTAAHWVGGYGAAKLMHTWTSVLTVLACAGFAARRSSRPAAIWAALAVSACPLALWESGTAYIDMASALYTALAMFLLADVIQKPTTTLLVLVAVCAGLTAATKYNGLLTVLLLAAICVFAVRGSRLRAPLIVLVVGLLVPAPWYVRTYLETDNPVYPFAYEVFGGKYWSAENAAIYRGEQVSFGVGRAPWELARIPWDLTVRPERYLNQGGVIGTLGVPLLLAPFLLGFARARPRAYWLLLSFCALNLAAWFWLSQQSRYVLALAPLLAVAVGWSAEEPVSPVRVWTRLSVVVQALVTLIVFTLAAPSVGLVSPFEAATVAFRSPRSEWVHEYLSERSSLYRAARAINAMEGVEKIAFYDEVLGYYFDKPYVWANPGHHTLIPYDRLHSGRELALELHRQGFSHVLLNVSNLPRELRDEWLPMLLSGSTRYPDPGRVERWRIQLGEAVQEGLLTPEQPQPGGPYLLFRVSVYR